MPYRIVNVLYALDDEELAARFQQGDLNALSVLIERYRGFTRTKVRAYFLVGAEHEDVEQEGLIGLYKAARDYRCDRDIPFRAFAEICVTRQVTSAVRAATRRKHQPLNRSVPLPSPHSPDGGDSPAQRNVRFRDPAADPAETILSRERMHSMRRSMIDALSILEVDVLRLYVEGRTYTEIGLQLGRHAKSIDNALQRIKRKLEHHRVADWAPEGAALAG